MAPKWEFPNQVLRVLYMRSLFVIAVKIIGATQIFPKALQDKLVARSRFRSLGDTRRLRALWSLCADELKGAAHARGKQHTGVSPHASVQHGDVLSRATCVDERRKVHAAHRGTCQCSPLSSSCSSLQHQTTVAETHGRSVHPNARERASEIVARRVVKQRAVRDAARAHMDTHAWGRLAAALQLVAFGAAAAVRRRAADISTGREAGRLFILSAGASSAPAHARRREPQRCCSDVGRVL